MEEYGLDGLAASADGVLAGLGPLVAGLARLAVLAVAVVTLDEMESLVLDEGRELLRGVVQLGLDRQADAEVRVAGGVAGADGVVRGRAERGHGRSVLTRLGVVVVRRIGYRAGERGVPSLFPRDAVLNLPPGRYSWALRRLVVMFARAGSYEQAREFTAAAAGVAVGKRQLEQITAAAAADAAAFCDAAAPGGPGERPDEGGQAGGQDGEAAGPGGPEGAAQLPLALSCDGKGVAMRPESRRARARAPGERVKNFSTRPGTGEKTGHKRIAETACVFDVIPAPRRTSWPAATAAVTTAAGRRHPVPPGPLTAATGPTSPKTGPPPSPGCSPRLTAATPATPGTGSPWSTAITTRSPGSRPKPPPAASPSPS